MYILRTDFNNIVDVTLLKGEVKRMESDRRMRSNKAVTSANSEFGFSYASEQKKIALKRLRKSDEFILISLNKGGKNDEKHMQGGVINYFTQHSIILDVSLKIR